MLVVSCLMYFIHSCLSKLMATCLLFCYGRTGRILGGRAVERSGLAMCGLHLTRED
jgi:hypothetical protein